MNHVNILEAHEMKFGFYCALFVQQNSTTADPVSVEAIRQLCSRNIPENKYKYLYYYHVLLIAVD